MKRTIKDETAIFIGLNLIPHDYRKWYYRKIYVRYKTGYEIVYLVQFLATGLHAIIFGVVASYVFKLLTKKSDEATSKKAFDKFYDVKIEPQLHEIDENIKDIKKILRRKEYEDKKIKYNEILGMYRKTLKVVKDKEKFYSELTKHALSRSKLSREDVKIFISKYEKK